MTENIKDALEYAVELAGKEQKVIKAENGRLYYDVESSTLRELDPKRYPPNLALNTLDSLVDYLKTKLGEQDNITILA